jgi:hypothetical protein
MTENQAVSPLSAADLTALIGIVGRLTGQIMGGALEADDVAAFARRAAKDGLVHDDAGAPELSEAYERLIDRIRFALGERH